MHASESNTGSETTGCVVEGQSVLGPLDAIVACIVVAVVSAIFFRLFDRGFDDILNLVVDRYENAAGDELKEHSGNDGRPRAGQTDDGIQNIPAEGGSRRRQQIKECRGDGNNQELRLGKDNLEEETDERGKANGRGTPHQSLRVGRRVSHCIIVLCVTAFLLLLEYRWI